MDGGIYVARDIVKRFVIPLYMEELVLVIMLRLSPRLVQLCVVVEQSALTSYRLSVP